MTVTNDPWITFGASIGVLIAIAVAYHVLDRNRGRGWIAHVIYWVAAGVVIGLVPLSIGQYIFTSLTVTLVGTVFPIYESVRAVCTPEEDDDKAWLQYWMVGGVFFMASTWVDDVIQSEKGDEIWFECITFLLLWLYFPKTDGATLIYDTITAPHISPRVRPLASKMNSVIEYIYQTLINAAHLWLLWIIFMFLPKGLKRIVSVAIGTVYPLLSSITAAATEDIEDDTYWLTYWSCYGCLFLIMDVVETWLGWIPGFYSLIIFSTIYLMLPMFQGSDKIFRKVLVPIAGLTEMLMLRDAITIKKKMLKDLHPSRAKTVRKAIAKFYDADDDDTADPIALKSELMQGWQSMKMSSLSNPFASSKKEQQDYPNETTPIV